MKAFRNMVAAVAIGSVALSGCATLGTSSGPKTIEEKIATCAAMVVIGAGLGAIIGNNTGSGDAGRGAGVGAAVGLGACAIWLAYQNEADQARIRDAQLLAVQTGQPQTAEWISPVDNLPRKVTVQPSTETRMFYTPEGGTEEERTCRAGGRHLGVYPQEGSSWEPEGAACFVTQSSASPALS